MTSLPTLKEMSLLPQEFAPGHRLCPGCGAGIIVRQISMTAAAAGFDLVWVNATGCLEVCTSIYPHTAWRSPWLHNAFENAAATISGVETAYKALKKRGKIDPNRKLKFIAIGGDGGTYDIGIQSLSGAMERGHDFIYVCYDNEAYMNTGIQRSGATPKYANTTTQPVGSESHGKPQRKKWLPYIAAAHQIPYVATVSPSHYKDFMKKIIKALNTKGPSFINAISVCPRGWRSKPENGILISRLAVETNYWPLFEVEDGTRWHITYRPARKKPIEDYLRLQGRFKHLIKPENKDLVENIEGEIAKRWDWLEAVEAMEKK